MTERIALVTWLDACFGKDSIPDPVLLGSVGWVVEDTDDRIVLAMEHDVDNPTTCRDFLTIPRAYVQAVQDLEASRLP